MSSQVTGFVDERAQGDTTLLVVGSVISRGSGLVTTEADDTGDVTGGVRSDLLCLVEQSLLTYGTVSGVANFVRQGLVAGRH